MKIRWSLTGLYWLALTRALLVTSPWREFGADHLAAEPDPSDPVSSFTLHASAYGILGLLLLWSLSGNRPRTRALWLAAAVGHGAVCEGLQGLVPNRWPSVIDVVANAAGVLLAVALIAALPKRIPKPNADAAPASRKAA